MPQWDSPLRGYEDAEPLPSTLNPDGLTVHNPPGSSELSSAYDEFPKEFDPSACRFDFHIYYVPSSPEESTYAKELYERIRREFPELPVYQFWDRPVGPHTTAMFEVDTLSPHQTGALFSGLRYTGDPASDVLIHPNTGDALRDHTELATWMCRRWPINDSILKKKNKDTA
ncbi:hypothetical protein CONPUDRAFT_59509 [Coniophora puteana RWD-64-598 SS2]|uniref:DOPA-like domain-containing protein n=1 Tax=Coniophora puteana (strain RWD-64-598) TaxID=741705 RepID=A0A5M3MJE0_CONPW|nr:uncharacterized protein CONPUDRAFT_59509 [Coniophora puteana RWD-64-598 SS2]EIW79369.1 hypothetical protein CONPUDRAFT_59509 [Coniophora puteana RWD-64-598 SS2]